MSTLTVGQQGHALAWPTVTRDGFTFETDKYGFPVVTCTRCGGSDSYSYNQLDGDRCYGCNRSGKQHPAGNASKAYAEWRNDRQAAVQVTGYNIQPGDEIRHYGSPKGTPFRKVATVHPTLKWTGSSLTGTNEADRIHYYATWLVFEDGGEEYGGNNLWTRKSTLDRAPYVERAQAAHVAKLRRAARKAC